MRGSSVGPFGRSSATLSLLNALALVDVDPARIFRIGSGFQLVNLDNSNGNNGDRNQARITAVTLAFGATLPLRAEHFVDVDVKVDPNLRGDLHVFNDRGQAQPDKPEAGAEVDYAVAYGWRRRGFEYRLGARALSYHTRNTWNFDSSINVAGVPVLRPTSSEGVTMPVATTPVLEIAYEERHPEGGEPIVLAARLSRRRTHVGCACSRGPNSPDAERSCPWLRGFGATAFPRRERAADGAGERARARPRRSARRAPYRPLHARRSRLGRARRVRRRRPRARSLHAGGRAQRRVRHERSVANHVVRASGALLVPMAVRDAARRSGVRDDRRGLCAYLWRTWSPSWQLHRRRVRAHGRGFRQSRLHERRAALVSFALGLRAARSRLCGRRCDACDVPPVRVPTRVLHGDEDGATLLEATEHLEVHFPDGYEREIVRGAGHFVQRERPDIVAAAIVRS